jgi:hypothetical protein
MKAIDRGEHAEPVGVRITQPGEQMAVEVVE